jgi:HK97 family phage portal protein
MSIKDRVTKAASIVLSAVGKTFTQPYFWTHSDLESYSTKAGVDLTHNAALSVTAYYSAVTLIAQTIGQLPLILYERMEPRGKSRAHKHQLYSILHDEPNEYMSARTFREVLQGHLLTWGNAFAEIEWDLSGAVPVVQSLFPLRPDSMQLEWQDKQLVYSYMVPTGETVKLKPIQVLHIPGFGFDGLIGYDPLTMFRESLGLTKACEEFGARFFGAGSTMSGVLSRPVAAPKLSDNARKMLRESFDAIHSGLSNAHKTAILEEGTTYQSIGVPPENGQFLECRKFQIDEVARIFHVPPHMIGDLEHGTFSNIEHQAIEFVKYCLGPWLKAWESEIHRKLLAPTEKDRYFAEFLEDALLRGDTQARFQAYATGRQWGWYSANDVRELENMNPVQGGDEYMVPLNMMPASMQLEAPQEKALQLKAGTDVSKRRAAVLRATIAERHTRPFADAARKLVAYESRAFRKGIVHLDTKDALTFEAWVTEFYGPDFKAYIVKRMSPAMKALADAIFPIASDEAGGDGKEQDEAKLKAYVEDFADRYMAVHKGQALAIETAEAAQVMLDEWAEVAADKIAQAETVGLSNAVAKLAFAAAGVRALRWVTIGSDNCPACTDLDGQTVTTLAPPLHDGCLCQLSPG